MTRAAQRELGSPGSAVPAEDQERVIPRQAREGTSCGRDTCGCYATKLLSHRLCWGPLESSRQLTKEEGTQSSCQLGLHTPPELGIPCSAQPCPGDGPEAQCGDSVAPSAALKAADLVWVLARRRKGQIGSN